MKKLSIILSLLSITICLYAQETPKAKIHNTFNSTRVINMNSVEGLEKRQLDVRITHRFGDMATTGSKNSFWGIEVADDIRIAFEYGLTDKLNVAVARLKGTGYLRELVEGHLKYRLLHQTSDNSTPISLSLFGNAVITARKASQTKSDAHAYTGFVDRLSYVSQVIIARKFSERFSIQLTPTFYHRNFVAFTDKNSLMALGWGTRFQISKNSGLILEGYNVFDSNRTPSNNYYMPLAIGYEVGTGGHTFQINLTNSKGIIENEFLAENQSDIGKGEFRIGFTISRMFPL